MENKRAVEILKSIPFGCLKGTDFKFVANAIEVKEAIGLAVEVLEFLRFKKDDNE